ncbi:MAG TPA: Gfo/Idh/MocA family oxidoreductase, partial [Phycisphaerae bacterium]|nr:Gfo/Idh/MocA family oxidoreductase [Phycisphaerae bacterium]
MNRSARIGRRTLLKASGMLTGGILGLPYLVSHRALAAAGRPGANDRLTVGHIGVGGMGTYHLRNMVERMKRGQVNVVAVCDVDESRLAEASRNAGPQADVYRDYRYILERKDIDVVVIATPDHWHAVQTVHAAECGKHVYVEKPACCTIEEGKAMVRAARENRISVQVGSQGRSEHEAYLAHRYLVNDNIGRIDRVWCFHYPSPSDDNPVPDSEPPPELDWDLWLGPMR